MSAPGRLLVAAAAVGALVALDLRTKAWAHRELRDRRPRLVADGHVTLRYQENPGIVFGLFRDTPAHSRRPFILAYSAASALVLLLLLVRRLLRPAGQGMVLSLGLVALLGGTLGNLVDRLQRGAVVDFIDYSARGRVQWPTFNVADVALAIGMAACLTGLLMSRRRPSTAPV